MFIIKFILLRRIANDHIYSVHFFQFVPLVMVGMAQHAMHAMWGNIKTVLVILHVQTVPVEKLLVHLAVHLQVLVMVSIVLPISIIKSILGMLSTTSPLFAEIDKYHFMI